MPLPKNTYYGLGAGGPNANKDQGIGASLMPMIQKQMQQQNTIAQQQNQLALQNQGYQVGKNGQLQRMGPGNAAPQFNPQMIYAPTAQGYQQAGAQKNADIAAAESRAQNYYNQAIASIQNASKQTTALLQPDVEANRAALEKIKLYNNIGTANDGGASLQKELQATPGYQFQLNEGSRLLSQQIASKGMLESGALLKELQSYGQGIASQTFNDSYNRLLNLAATTSPSVTAQAAQLQNMGTQTAGLQGSLADLAGNMGLAIAQTSYDSTLGASQTFQGQTPNYDQWGNFLNWTSV
jgi:hypothetical protein